MKQLVYSSAKRPAGLMAEPRGLWNSHAPAPTAPRRHLHGVIDLVADHRYRKGAQAWAVQFVRHHSHAEAVESFYSRLPHKPAPESAP